MISRPHQTDSPRGLDAPLIGARFVADAVLGLTGALLTVTGFLYVPGAALGTDAGTEDFAPAMALFGGGTLPLGAVVAGFLDAPAVLLLVVVMTFDALLGGV